MRIHMYAEVREFPLRGIYVAEATSLRQPRSSTKMWPRFGDGWHDLRCGVIEGPGGNLLCIAMLTGIYSWFHIAHDFRTENVMTVLIIAV